MKPKYFTCQCGGEILRAEFNDEYKEIDMSFYSYGIFTEKPTLWERIKFCFRYLKTGEMYSDYILLSIKDAQRLGNWLVDIVENNNLKR